MFDHHPRRVPWTRRLGAGAGSGVGGVGLLAALVGLGMPDPAPEPVPLDPIAVVYEPLPPHTVAAIKPAGGGGAGVPKVVAPRPVSPTEAPPEAAPEVPERPALDPKMLQSIGRVTDGGWGEGEGPGTGDGVGLGPGGLGSGVGGPDRALQVRREVFPRFPKAARKLGEDALCELVFTVDPEGVPTEVNVQTCAPLFHPAVLEAAWKWRFYPLLVNGEAQATTFKLRVRFKVW